MTVKFITLGCKTNIYETAAMAQLFEAVGFEVINRGAADVCVVNTCTVTATGAAKSLKQIRKARRENESGILAVCGCLAQTEAERLKREVDIDVLIGNKYRHMIVSLCLAAMQGKKCEKIEDISKAKEYEELGIVRRQSRIRAEIKIEDGCNNFCSYCKIPYARGPVRSRDINYITKEAEALLESGYKEAVLTGIHIGSYGKDLDNKIGLIDVIEAVAKVGIPRLRLGSLEPVMIDGEFCSRAARIKSLCPQFHLSLQSGCDNTLKAMRRRYTTEDFRRAVYNLRNAFCDAAITTDLIVGFPGESEADFEASKAFCEEIGFSQMHIFPYSKREGTAAAEFENQVLEQTKTERTQIMLNSAKAMKKAFYQEYIGKQAEVLFEQSKNGVFLGMTKNYMNVALKTDKDLKARFVNCRVIGYNEDVEALDAEWINPFPTNIR